MPARTALLRPVHIFSEGCYLTEIRAEIVISVPNGFTTVGGVDEEEALAKARQLFGDLEVERVSPRRAIMPS